MLTPRIVSRQRLAGFGLIEVLISMAILAVGLLGLAKLQAGTHQLEMESYQRDQALILLQDMVSRMRNNRKAADCYTITTQSNGSPYLGTTGTGHAATPVCSLGVITQQATAVQDLSDWDGMLQGAAETDTSNSANVGAMIGARGCIAFDVPSNNYVVTIAWQGLIQTAAPSAGLPCATGLYGNESQRRVVSAVINFAVLDP